MLASQQAEKAKRERKKVTKKKPNPPPQPARRSPRAQVRSSDTYIYDLDQPLSAVLLDNLHANRTQVEIYERLHAHTTSKKW